MLKYARELVKVEVGIDPLGPFYASLTITDAAERAIREEGPMDTKALGILLLRRGIKSKSTNFTNNLFAALHKDQRFVHRPNPEGGKRSRLWDLKTKK